MWKQRPPVRLTYYQQPNCLSDFHEIRLVIHKKLFSKREFLENRHRDSHISLTGVNQFPHVTVLSTFLDLRICAKFGTGGLRAMPLIVLSCRLV